MIPLLLLAAGAVGLVVEMMAMIEEREQRSFSAGWDARATFGKQVRKAEEAEEARECPD